MTRFVKINTLEGTKIGALDIHEPLELDQTAEEAFQAIIEPTVGAEPKQCGSSSAVTTVPSGQ